MSEESVNNKRIAKNTLVLYLRMLVIMIITLYTSRIILNNLGIIDFGIYNVVGGVVTILTFLNSSLSISTQRFITFELGIKDNRLTSNVFGTSVILHLFVAIFVFIAILIVGTWFILNKMTIPEARISAALYVIIFSVLTCCMSVINTPFYSLIISHEKMNVFAYISIVEVILKVIVAYTLSIVAWDKLVVYSFLLFVIQNIITLIYFFYAKNKYKEASYPYKFDPSIAKKMVRFTSWSVLSTFSWMTLIEGINILLNVFFNPTINAARGIAFQVQATLKKFVDNFQTALNPQITKSFGSNNLDYMHRLIYSSSKYSFFLLYIFSFPVMTNAEYILKLWLVNVPDYTVIFLKLTLVIAMIDSVFNSYMIGVQATGNQKRLQMTVGVIWLFVIPISYIFLKLKFPPQTVFIVQLIVSLIAQVTGLILTHKQIDLNIMHYLRNVILRIIVVVVISYTICHFMFYGKSTTFLECMYSLTINFLIIFVTIALFGLSKSEYKTLLQFVRLKLQKGV